ncbi:tRNA (adenosine(37)-N6)-threonylcarbamoyltransferase complex ATPase subunit type 1 TsaE [Mycoplasmopsis agassizii]|uniref:tRNA (adenosine(37)-N6)-threonylcarbamoyltransferase complex ATPase subunit type 1 TsaE n=1 Tax=Mycoplasmopsis agassizii TaxID=33922 RepID=UPI003529A843
MKLVSEFKVKDRKELEINLKPFSNLLLHKKISLEGNLGSGKTTFVQVFAKILDIKEVITSPTFNIMKTYENLVHMDVYNHQGDLDFYEDYFDDNTVLIEWGSRVKNYINFDFVIYISKENNFYNYKIMQVN